MSGEEKIRVLLVEDSATDADLIQRELFRIGLAVTSQRVETASGLEEALLHFSPDIVLSDFRLPTFGGMAALEVLQVNSPGTPFILVSGSIGEELAIEVLRAGATDYVLKDRLTRLGPVIRRALRESTERRDRERAEQEVRKLAAFPRLNPHPVMELDANGRVLYANAAAEKLARELGLSGPAAMLPMDVAGLLRELSLSGQSVLRRDRMHGSRIISWQLIPIRELGTVHAYAQDVTEQLRMQAQLQEAQRLESIGRLASGVAHDFNNLLTVIQGHTDLLLAVTGFSASQRGSLSRIAQASERAANLTRQLLTFSRQRPAQRVPLDLNRTIADIDLMLRNALGEGFRLELLLGQGLAHVSADPAMIEQALLNLLLNARDAMPGGGTVKVSTERVRLLEAPPGLETGARAGDFVRLRVHDDGVGMDHETLSRIFEPFFTTKGVGKGTGLGLAAVHGIVKQHEGWIDVASEPGRGTEFCLYLPVNLQPELPFELHDELPDLVGGSERILLVEDQPEVRELAASVLRSQGYQVVEAVSGVDALRIWPQERDRIQLLLTDVVMPDGLSGRDLATKLLADQPKLRVLFMSGFTRELMSSDFELREGDNFIQKPYHPDALVRVVRRCLDRGLHV